MRSPSQTGDVPLSPKRPNPPVEFDRIIPGEPDRWISREICVIPFSAAMREREALLQRALVAAVVGSVSPPPVAQVHAALCTELDLTPDSFSVRPFYPENFLLHFRSSEECRRVALRRSIRLGGTRLLVAPWSRHLHAEAGSMLFRVRLHLEGIPGHAWGELTAAAILGTSCRISSCDPVSVTAGDMAVFKLHAWTFDPSAIPKEKTLRIVEDEGLVVAPQGTGERYLDYTVYIHLTAVEDNAAPPVPYLSFAPSSDDTGHGGLPRSDDSDEGPPHRHFFRTTRGCRDGSPRPRPQASQGGGRDGGRQAGRVRADLPATSAVRQERRPSRQSLLPYSRAASASPPALRRRRRPHRAARPRRRQATKSQGAKAKVLLSPVRSFCRWQPRRRQTSPEVVLVAPAASSAAPSSDKALGQRDSGFVPFGDPVDEVDSAPSSMGSLLSSSGSLAQHPPPNPIRDDSLLLCWQLDRGVHGGAHDPMLEEAAGWVGPVPHDQLVGVAASRAGPLLQVEADPMLDQAGLVMEQGSPSRPLQTSAQLELGQLAHDELAESAHRETPTPPVGSAVAVFLGLHCPVADPTQHGGVHVPEVVASPQGDASPGSPRPGSPRPLITFSRRAKKGLSAALLPPPPTPAPPTVTPFIPRRSERQAAQPLHGAPTMSRCQVVLSKRLGVEADVPPRQQNPSALQQYTEIFDNELSTDHVQALADLFDITLPSPQAEPVATLAVQVA